MTAEEPAQAGGFVGMVLLLLTLGLLFPPPALAAASNAPLAELVWPADECGCGRAND